MTRNGPKLEVCFTDTGGTFTDTFLVDERGDFVVAKAPTTPQDLSLGYFASVQGAAAQRGLALEGLYPQLAIIGYGSTTVINTILTRRGTKLGLIITKGFEHLLLMERGAQTYTEYDIIDRIHARTHRHTDPLIPYPRTRGVTERIDCLGEVIIPMYEEDCRQAARELIEMGCQAICVNLLFCWQNPVHELRARELISEVAREMGREVEVYLSHEINPIGRELARLNGTMIEAYTRPIVIESWRRIEDQLQRYGFRGRLQVMQSTGGLASLGVVKVVETLESGPVGGLVGGYYIGRHYGFENLITTDVGGTSFDVGLINRGVITVQQEPVCARMLLGIPMAQVDSIGAGGGTIARIDPLTGRLLVGPDSAGAVPGPVCYDQGGEEPTVTDADLVLGYLNPDYFLGGRLPLNKEKARRAIGEKIAKPLGISIEAAAEGINSILDVRMKDTILGMVMARGFEISDYYLLSFGGAGPSHVAGYTEAILFKGIMVFPYSAVFSAFGAASADYQHNYTRAANLVAPPNASAEIRLRLCRELSRIWTSLEEQALQEMGREGFAKGQVRLEHRLLMRYGRQLDQIMVKSPLTRLESVEDWEALVAAFERTYEAMFTRAAKYPQAGYEIVEVSLQASAEKIKPKLARHPLGSAEPSQEARKGNRQCYFKGRWVDTQIYEWELLTPGNTLNGPAIMEHPDQTLVVPPGRSVRVDEYLTVWMT